MKRKDEMNQSLSGPREQRQETEDIPEELNVLLAQLKQAEELFPVKVPSAEQLDQQLAKKMKQQKAASRRELAWFSLSSLAVISVSFLTFTEIPAVFMGIQLAASLGIPAGYLLVLQRKRRKDEVL
ncbi:YxlC family protein [Paenibacillus larvae]|uniref:YxlC family protein n=1 Tax=Paenibacillus larvae TaxID=1464 RepID=UPI00227DEC4C|nr:YxlC family protein [Paenibacillus larvae]MCY9509006.1 YxlC family protein [Paenibacillus larvae]MCY9524606.1 YxlC family protein [Paenibacillus larvae]